MILERRDIDKNDRWDVETLYANFEQWEKEFESHQKWEDFLAFKGHLSESSSTLLKALRSYFNITRQLDKLYTYAHLRHDENIVEESAKNYLERIFSLNSAFQQAASWLEPEILSLSEMTLNEYLKSNDLKDFHFYLNKLISLKKHTLSPEQEWLIALASQPLQVAHKAFSTLNNADFQFDKVVDAKGESHDLSHGLYRVYLKSPDRTLRQNSYKNYYAPYQQYENTLSELLAGQMQVHHFVSKARGYQNCLEGALKPNNIPTKVYTSLIEAVHEQISILHRYISLRRKLLNIPKVAQYDLYAPLAMHHEQLIPYDEAVDLIIQSVEPLGNDYQNLLADGLKKKGWVDRYENKNKRSGAYSSGCYDSVPYILLNYKGLLGDVLTLAHEAGHSMHSLLSNQTQAYHEAGYPIFLAEIASTFNEELLFRLLLKRSKNTQEANTLLAQKAEDLYATLFRQTLFAEFELQMHQWTEQNIPITPSLLKAQYRKLNEFYFGPDFETDDCLQVEWGRIPHFYYNFYVYQYATGVSTALTLAQKVLGGGDVQRQSYLNLLKGGYSRYPIDLLAAADIDIQSKDPVIGALKRFEEIIDELENRL